MYRLVIDEQSIYEVDEECLKKKERNEKCENDEKMKKENEKRGCKKSSLKEK